MTAPTSTAVVAPDSVPKSMAEALDWDSPDEALLSLSASSSWKAQSLSSTLESHLLEWLATVSVIDNGDTTTNQDDNLTTSMACVDSIFHCLTKIATGGTQASQEIRTLEQEKTEMEQHALDVETALNIRSQSDRAVDALGSQNYAVAAQQVQAFVSQQNLHTPRALAYAGEYTVEQMHTTIQVLRTTLLERYAHAVQQENLGTLGQLTPLMQQIQLEGQAVSLYLQFLQNSLPREWKQAAEKPLPLEAEPTALPQSRASQKRQEARQAQAPPPPPFLQMARIYNGAVTALRHHLPMISHWLYAADGDVALVQLVHAQVEHLVIPLFHIYIQDRHLNVVARQAQRIYGLLETKYVGLPSSSSMEDDEHTLTEDMDDCGFSVQVGSLGDVDGALEEAALCVQHAESYLRFVQHTVTEVNKARKLRYDAEQEELKLQRDRQEWATGVAVVSQKALGGPYVSLEVLPAYTPLHEVVAEVGGYYSGIERCLLLASMQRAFQGTALSDPSQYTPLGTKGNHLVGSRAVQTSLVETCLYAARRGTQRAFATGHTGTASAMANFANDCLGGVLLEVMTRRAQESGVAPLQPGEGLLEGSSSLASNLIRQGNAAVVGRVDESTRQQKVQQGIANACATINDLDVAVQHTQQLEGLLLEAIDAGFPPQSHDTEQLRLCVKSLTSVTEGFRKASDGAIESLISIVTPRVRAIVGDAVGSESAATTASSFMGTSVMGGTKATDRTTVRMNYNLDDAAYKLLQLGEGYMARLCSTLDELIHPLRLHLSPPLSDALVLGVMGIVAKRLEGAIRRCHFTALGALSLDSDMRELSSYIKERLDSAELHSNVALNRACPPLARLLQISKLLNVDDLEDVVDLISSSKRKGNWDLKLEDAKSFLGLRVEFESRKVNELLRISEEE